MISSEEIHGNGSTTQRMELIILIVSLGHTLIKLLSIAFGIILMPWRGACTV